MKLIIEIEMDNDAFEDVEPHVETARILERYAARLRNGGEFTQAKLIDVNGNTVGSARIARKEAAR